MATALPPAVDQRLGNYTNERLNAMNYSIVNVLNKQSEVPDANQKKKKLWPLLTRMLYDTMRKERIFTKMLTTFVDSTKFSYTVQPPILGGALAINNGLTDVVGMTVANLFTYFKFYIGTIELSHTPTDNLLNLPFLTYEYSDRPFVPADNIVTVNNQGEAGQGRIIITIPPVTLPFVDAEAADKAGEFANRYGIADVPDDNDGYLAIEVMNTFSKATAIVPFDGGVVNIYDVGVNDADRATAVAAAAVTAAAAADHAAAVVAAAGGALFYPFSETLIPVAAPAVGTLQTIPGKRFFLEINSLRTDSRGTWPAQLIFTEEDPAIPGNILGGAAAETIVVTNRADANNVPNEGNVAFQTGIYGGNKKSKKSKKNQRKNRRKRQTEKAK